MYQYPYGNAQQLNLDWILSKLQELESGSGGGVDLEEVANALVSASFDAAIPYRKYDYAFYDGKLYRALNDTIGAFNPADWLEVTLGADIPVLTRLVNADSALLTTLQNAVNNEKDELNAIQNNIIIEQGAIADATGKDAENEARLRTKGFLPPYFSITVAQPTTYDIRVKGTYYYDENNNFIQYLERNSYSVTVDSATNPNKYKVRLSFWANDSEQTITPSDLILSNYQVTDGIQTQIDNLNGAITSVEKGLAIIVTGDTCSTAVPSGGYAYIKNNTHGLTEGLYKNKTASAFPTSGGTANSTVFEAVPSGGLNDIINSGAGYFRTADGTQICWGDFSATISDFSPYGTYYQGAGNPNEMFAQPFISAPNVVVTPYTNVWHTVLQVACSYEGFTNITVERQNNNTVTISEHYIAIGRWK